MASRSMGRALMLLADIAKIDGDLARAQELLEEAMVRIRAEDPGGRHFPQSLAELGDLLRLRGDQPAALATLAEALRVGAAVYDSLSITASLHRMALVRSSLGEREVAARLGAAAERAHQEFGFAPEADEHVLERVEPAWSEGRAMSLDEAVEYALSTVD
jgi:tetratricopeptide (TPR) repeat protein